VITHWRGSLHPRHVLTHDAVVEAVKMAADPKVQTESAPHQIDDLYYGENCEDLNGFIPQVYIEIEDTFDQWFEALSHYELFAGGKANVPYNDYYRTMAVIRAIEVGNQKLSKAFMNSTSTRQFFHE